MVRRAASASRRVATRLVLPLLLGLFLGLLWSTPGAADEGDEKSPAAASPAAVGPTELRSAGTALLREAGLAFERGERDAARAAASKAEDHFRRLAKLEVRDPRVVYMATEAAILQGDAERARIWLERYGTRTGQGGGEPRYHFLLALIELHAANRPGQAVDALRAMYKLAPKDMAAQRDALYYEALLAHGASLARAGNYDAGLERFRRAVKLARGNGWTARVQQAEGNMAVTMRRASRHLEALELLEGLIKRNPGNVQWLWEKGLNLAAQVKYPEAIAVYKRVEAAREKLPKDSPAERGTRQVLLRLGNCLRQLAGEGGAAGLREKRLAEAQVYLERYVAVAPKDARGHRWLGEYWLEDRERPYRAIPHFERAMDLDPDCATSLRRLVQVHGRFPPPADARTSEGRARWQRRLDELQKDLTEGADRREAALKAREKANGYGVTGCE